MAAERKNISAINRHFAVTTDQSCLNRWLVEASLNQVQGRLWDAAALNDRRLAWLQDNPKTRYSPRGVIAIDNTLVDHSGKLIEDVGWLGTMPNSTTILRIKGELQVRFSVCTGFGRKRSKGRI